MGKRAEAIIDPKLDIYVSFDIEADGPVPGLFSMLSIGFCVAGTFDSKVYERRSPGEHLYLELKPVTDAFLPDAVAVSGLDRERLKVEALEPGAAIPKLITWLTGVSAGQNLVLVAYPSAFDWPFLAHYFQRYSTTGPPLSFTRVCDLRTMIVTKAGKSFYTPTAECLPQSISLRPHTHHALQDAIDQAELFSDVFDWRRTWLTHS